MRTTLRFAPFAPFGMRQQANVACSALNAGSGVPAVRVVALAQCLHRAGCDWAVPRTTPRWGCQEASWEHPSLKRPPAMCPADTWRWLLSILIGAVMGVLAFLVDWGIDAMNGFKFSAVTRAVATSGADPPHSLAVFHGLKPGRVARGCGGRESLEAGAWLPCRTGPAAVDSGGGTPSSIHGPLKLSCPPMRLQAALRRPI